MPWERSRVVVAIVGLLTITILRGVAWGDQIHEPNSASTVESLTVDGSVATSSQSAWPVSPFEPRRSSAEAPGAPDFLLDITLTDSAADKTADRFQRVAEPQSFALFGTGLILLGFAKRAKGANLPAFLVTVTAKIPLSGITEGCAGCNPCSGGGGSLTCQRSSKPERRAPAFAFPGILRRLKLR